MIPVESLSYDERAWMVLCRARRTASSSRTRASAARRSASSRAARAAASAASAPRHSPRLSATAFSSRSRASSACRPRLISACALDSCCWGPEQEFLS